MAAIHGVETNVASRFIDHTVATPWETLLNDIESGLRTISKAGETGVKVDIHYNGLTYRLEKRRSTNPKKIESISAVKSDRVKDYTWLHSTYNIGWFILFSHGHHSADYHASYRTTMLSAFITVVRSFGSGLNISIPIFFSHSYVTDISQAADLIGYQNMTSPANTTIAPTEVVPKPRWCRYEAHICSMLHFHPPFKYFDGIRKVLQNQFRILRLGGPTADNYYVDAEFSFVHGPDTIYGSIGREGTNNSPSSHSTGSKLSAKATGVSIFNSGFLKRLSGLIPNDEISCTLLTETQIELVYPSQPQNLITDNAQRTTFLPSQQPPNGWSLAVSFKNLPRVSLGDLGIPTAHTQNTNNTRNPYTLAYHSAGSEHALSASWMSLSVRKLLSFYLLSVYCTRAKVNVETMSAEIESTANLLDKNVLDRINEVLSDESRAVFYSVCRQQIDAKLAAHTQIPSMTSPLPSNSVSTPKGRMASVQRDAAPGNLASLGAAAASPTRGGRSASVVTGSTSAVSPAVPSSGSHSPAPVGLNAISANLFGEDGGWSARMERHRAVVEILFSGECVFSAQVAQGAQLDCPISSSVGLWMGMFSLLCASSAVDAHDMANMWSKCMRRVHIACEDGQPLPTFTPATETFSVEPVSEKTALICLRTLWDDAIERLHEEDTQRSSSCQGGLPLAWPDQQESIVVQKLQQLQFCIATQNEVPLYQFPTPSVEVEVRTGPDMTTSGNAKPNTTERSSAPTEAGPTARRCTVQQPTLFRRLPLTEDMITMNKYLARKLNLSSSRSNREHPTLKVQLQVPSILSDIKAFKAANPNLDVYTFCAWYGIDPVVEATINAEEDPTTSISASTTMVNKSLTQDNTTKLLKIPLEDMNRAWASCEAMACEDQGRALFLVEKESEKAMAYLESVTAVQLASEMLHSGIKLVFGILAKQFDPWLDDDVECDGDCEANGGKKDKEQSAAALCAWKSKLRSDLALLKEQVENAVYSLRPDPSTETNSSSTSTSSKSIPPIELNINTVIFVDSVAGLIQKLEALSIKLQTLGALFARSSAVSVDAMIHTLSRRDSFTAETEAERNALYELTRALHHAQEQTQDPQVHDGHELGEPSKKTFKCRLHPPRGPLSGPSAPSASLINAQPLAAPTRSTGESSQSAAVTFSSQDVFHMQATLQQRPNQKDKQLHVAFRVLENM